MSSPRRVTWYEYECHEETRSSDALLRSTRGRKVRSANKTPDLDCSKHEKCAKEPPTIFVYGQTGLLLLLVLVGFVFLLWIMIPKMVASTVSLDLSLLLKWKEQFLGVSMPLAGWTRTSDNTTLRYNATGLLLRPWSVNLVVSNNKEQNVTEYHTTQSADVGRLRRPTTTDHPGAIAENNRTAVSNANITDKIQTTIIPKNSTANRDESSQAMAFPRNDSRPEGVHPPRSDSTTTNNNIAVNTMQFTADNTTNIAVKSPLSNASGNEALEFVHRRRQVYEAQGLYREWKLRGIGYLYSKLQMVLFAEVPAHPQPGHNTIRIVNIHPNSSTVGRTDCDLLTIWVRVNGPEILAGQAQAVSDNTTGVCHWEYPFDLHRQGSYKVDAKVLVWNGLAPIGGNDRSQCEYQKGNITDGMEFPVHAGFVGFKLHYPQKSCCEICTRLAPHCRYWVSPAAKIPRPTYATNGCELYFDQDVPEDVIPRSRLLQNATQLYIGGRRDGERPASYYHGKPHTNPTAYFVGCGWDNWFTLDFPCLSGNLDDRVYTNHETFVFSPEKNVTSRAAEEVALPLCTVENEHLNVSSGRWVREQWPDSKTCPMPMKVDEGFGKKFDIMTNDGNHPHCWHRDDLSHVGHYCSEWNCRLIQPESKWISELHEENEWFGVWRQYGCGYLEFTDTQLQQCITKRKIASIETEGNSIARFMREYLELRLKNVTMYDGGSEAVNVTIDTLTLVALSMNPEDHYFGVIKKLKKMPVVEANREHYWVTGFFLSSEREPHIQVARMEKFNKIVPGILHAKGYKMINAFDMSAAFTYDTATQFDGLHLIGPPMKMIITKLFHHMCSGIVEGSAL